MKKDKRLLETLDVVVVGAGASGIGMGVVLKDLGITRFRILERYEVGASFNRWTEGMRFITPSFTSNSFGFPDLNAVTFDTSPAFTLRTEHPTGKEYAAYLRRVADNFELPVDENIEVKQVRKLSDGFLIETNRDPIYARFVIWAAGEFQFPRTNGFKGATHCQHSSHIKTFDNYAAQDAVIIGGYESGIDAACRLAAKGVKVRVVEQGNTWETRESDPSVALAPVTLGRLRKAVRRGNLELHGGTRVERVERRDDQDGSGYLVYAATNNSKTFFATSAPPIMATGFTGSCRLIDDLFEWRDDGLPCLTEHDESTATANLFLIGPSVRQDNIIFCFIYKFRARFAVVANKIAERMKIDTAPLEVYRRRGMYLDDLSCCTSSCEC